MRSWPTSMASVSARKGVARLMCAAGLQGATLRKYVVTTSSDPLAPKPIDLVERKFQAAKPDQLWVADITYIPTWSGFLYLAMVLDVYSRRFVGWAMDTNLKTPLILDALAGQLRASPCAVRSKKPEHLPPGGGRPRCVVRSMKSGKTESRTKTTTCPPKRANSRSAESRI